MNKLYTFLILINSQNVLFYQGYMNFYLFENVKAYTFILAVHYKKIKSYLYIYRIKFI